MQLQAFTRNELLAQGFTSWSVDAAVASGRLVRARRDRYFLAGSEPLAVEAVRVGGRLTCLSLLKLLGVFVHSNRRLHVHVAPQASRLREPKGGAPLRRGDPVRKNIRLHWTPLVEPAASLAAVGLKDALIHAVLCQTPRNAVATLDSALNRGLITLSDLDEIFDGLPRRYRVLLGLVDGRAQSGTETLVRLMARQLGCRVEPQVAFPKVGWVDLVIDGWLVVECDSKQFHSEWKDRRADYERDLVLARHGMCVFRVTAETILNRPDDVATALRSLVATHR